MFISPPILSRILTALPDGEVVDVRIGLHWTAVVVRTGGALRCGLASTLHGPDESHGMPAVPEAGRLLNWSAGELAELALHGQPICASIGMAALNALLPRYPQAWSEENAEELLARHASNRRLIMIGHFPFVERLRAKVGELIVLEQHPGPGDLPAERAPELLPTAGAVAITGMTFANRTFEPLLALCPAEAFVVVLGPSTPLSPILFEYGVDVISGAVVTAIDPVLRVLSQGGNFRQIHHAGVRLGEHV